MKSEYHTGNCNSFIISRLKFPVGQAVCRLSISKPLTLTSGWASDYKENKVKRLPGLQQKFCMSHKITNIIILRHLAEP